MDTSQYICCFHERSFERDMWGGRARLGFWILCDSDQMVYMDKSGPT